MRRWSSNADGPAVGRARRFQPGVRQPLGCRGPELWPQVQHGRKEVAEALRLFAAPLVLVLQHVAQRPGPQLADVAQGTWKEAQTASLPCLHEYFDPSPRLCRGRPPNSPLVLKKCLECLPLVTRSLGRGPSSSMMCARWSSSRE